MAGKKHDRLGRMADRWADMTQWPTARKTVFAMSVALVFHMVVPALALLIFAKWASDLVDVPLLTKFFAAWGVVIAGIIAVALPVARSGREGRWRVGSVDMVNPRGKTECAPNSPAAM